MRHLFQALHFSSVITRQYHKNTVSARSSSPGGLQCESVACRTKGRVAKDSRSERCFPGNAVTGRLRGSSCPRPELSNQVPSLPERPGFSHHHSLPTSPALAQCRLQVLPAQEAVLTARTLKAGKCLYLKQGELTTTFMEYQSQPHDIRTKCIYSHARCLVDEAH